MGGSRAKAKKQVDAEAQAAAKQLGQEALRRRLEDPTSAKWPVVWFTLEVCCKRGAKRFEEWLLLKRRTKMLIKTKTFENDWLGLLITS